ncbi:MAG TPA: hypothetical protein VMY37_19785 [Thermoguttaceae bacterium]|nr:hypothetical protein [Thermoguttaceae bacterium]
MTIRSTCALAKVNAVEWNDVPVDADPGEEGDQPEVTQYYYDLAGNPDRTDLPNGAITDYVYDERNRLDVPTHYAPDATPGDLGDNPKIAEFDYTVRADGKRTAADETSSIRAEAARPGLRRPALAAEPAALSCNRI